MSSDQKKAMNNILEWYKKDSQEMQYITLGGFAGTGKTTLISILRKKLDKINKKLKVGFASYTGKATRVLLAKIKDSKTILKQDSVSTIHSLIYSPVVNDRQEIIGWKLKDKIDPQLIIIDEASMVDSVIWKHLLSYKIPIVVVGDHGQLPPIAGNFNLMEKPDLVLTEIHRQAKDNPIIKLSIDARQKGMIESGRYSNNVVKFDRNDFESGDMMGELLANYSADTLILCGYNATRKSINSHIRKNIGFDSVLPQVGDRVICLRNNHKVKIYNGMLGVIKEINYGDKKWFDVDIQMDGEDRLYSGLIMASQFGADNSLNFTGNRKDTVKGDLFDFGYALTVHKAQGSQAKRVILFEERFAKMDEDSWRRWLYTAVTRAEEELYIFGR
ncbi:ATP-dependent RecD-like DNA helicase [Patescibacteria group bacterium]